MSPVAPEMKKKVKIQGLEKGFKEENLKKKLDQRLLSKVGTRLFFRPTGTLGFRCGDRPF